MFNCPFLIASRSRCIYDDEKQQVLDADSGVLQLENNSSIPKIKPAHEVRAGFINIKK